MCRISVPRNRPCTSLMYKQNSKGPSTDPCGTPRLVKAQSEASLLFNTCYFLPVRYECIQQRAERDRPMLLSLRSSFVWEIVSNAFEKSNSSATVTSFLSKPNLMSSVSLSTAVAVLWPFLKPVWNGSRMFFCKICSVSWSWTNFFRTFERKLSKAIGRKSNGAEGADFFLNRISCAFFQAPGKMPLSSDVLKRVTRNCPTAGRAFAITLCGIPSSPLACDVKWATTRMTSLSEKWWNKNPL